MSDTDWNGCEVHPASERETAAIDRCAICDADEIERLRGENLALTNEVDVLRFAGEVQGERLSAEIGQLEGLLRKIDGILKSGLSASHQRLQIALLIEGAAIAGAADQPNATCERGEARSPVCPLPESGCDDSGSATVQPAAAQDALLTTLSKNTQPDAGQSSPADGQPAAEGVARAAVVPQPYGEGRANPRRGLPEVDDDDPDGLAMWADPPAPRNPALAEFIQLDHEIAHQPKRAYHETHEPPHCPTCECWQEIDPKARHPEPCSLCGEPYWNGHLASCLLHPTNRGKVGSSLTSVLVNPPGSASRSACGCYSWDDGRGNSGGGKCAKHSAADNSALSK